MRGFGTHLLACTSPSVQPRPAFRPGAAGPFAFACGYDLTKTLPVLSFAKLEQGMPMPHLLDVQTRAFASLLQPDGKGAERTDVGLERGFKDVLPIQDVNGNYSLEFVKYALGESKYSVEECIERDMTYSVPLKATLQLVVMEEVGETTKTKRPKNIIEKEVYLGELPILT